MSDIVAQADATTTPSTGIAPRDLARQQFIKHFDDFLKALSEVFSDDATLRDYCLKYRIAIVMMGDAEEKKKNEEAIVTMFNKEASHLFDRMIARDPTVVKELTFIEWFAPLFEKADEETRTVIWEYTDLLVQHCVCFTMYSKIPQKVSSALGSISEKVESGSIDPTQMDVANLSAEILKSVNPTEMQEFALSMMSDEVAMKNLCRIASSQIQKAAPAGDSKTDASS